MRPATADDAAAVLAIYAPIVESTPISFELTPPTREEMARRIRATMARHPWLVAVADDGVAGYAYAAPHKDRPAYRWSVDTSVYVHQAWRSRGIGRTLYRALLDELRSLGYVSAYAGVTLPNDASVALHESVGFAAAGRYPNAGFKLGAWHDVGWWHLSLRPPPRSPEEPRSWRL